MQVIPEKFENDMIVFQLENLQIQNRMHIERNEAYAQLVKKLPENLVKINKEKFILDELFNQLQINLIRYISDDQNSQQLSVLRSLQVNNSQQNECYYQRSIKDCHSVQQSNQKDSEGSQIQDKALSANNRQNQSFEFFGETALPYSKKYPYKLKKHIHFFKKNLQAQKIQSKFFTIEFVLMHWIEYFQFVNCKIPTNQQIKQRIQQLDVKQFDIHSYVCNFNKRNIEFLNSLNN